jgi:hypothetical protein
MILVFPDINIIYLVLKESLIPQKVISHPVFYVKDQYGQYYIQTTDKLSKSTLQKLQLFGVRPSSQMPPAAAIHEAYCWGQLVPLQKVSDNHLESIPQNVIIEISNFDELKSIVHETLRLGNDRLSILNCIQRQDNQSIYLLHVSKPSYYTLLRALDDELAIKNSITIYYEQIPRCWVELGWSYPLAQYLNLPEDRQLFISAPQHWNYINNRPFENIYQVLDIQVSIHEYTWQPVCDPPKLKIPLYLIPNNIDEKQASLWLIPADKQLDFEEWLKRTDEKVLSCFDYTVADIPEGEERYIILRCISSNKSTVPAMSVPSIAHPYVQHTQIRDLYLPKGYRLQPNIRPETLQRLLCMRDDYLIWLQRTDDRNFRSCAISLKSFRQLTDWIDYILSQYQVALQEWIDATTFAWPVFNGQINEPLDSGPTPPQPPQQREDTAVIPHDPEISTFDRHYTSSSQLQIRKHSSIQHLDKNNQYQFETIDIKELTQLENQFQQIEGIKLDDAKRIPLWSQLAEAYSRLQIYDQATLCWLHTLWHAHDKDIPKLIDRWFHIQWKQITIPSIKQWRQVFDQPLITSTVLHRQLVTLLYWLVHHQSQITSEMLQAFHRFLENNQHRLPLRGIWLAHLLLGQSMNNPLLSLRVADQLLQMLTHDSSIIVRDLPQFLHDGSLHYQNTLRHMRENLPELLITIEKWISLTSERLYHQKSYIYYFFAYVAASLKMDTWKQWHQEARNALHDILPEYKDNEVIDLYRSIIDESYTFRIENANDLRYIPHLPQSLHDKIKYLDTLCHSQQDHVPRLAIYAVRRLLQKSEILEPMVQPDAFTVYLSGDINDNIDIGNLISTAKSLDECIMAIRVVWISSINKDGIIEINKKWNNLLEYIYNLLHIYKFSGNHDTDREITLYHIVKLSKLYEIMLFTANSYSQESIIYKIIQCINYHYSYLREHYDNQSYHYLLLSRLVFPALVLKRYYHDGKLLEFLKEKIGPVFAQTKQKLDLFNDDIDIDLYLYISSAFITVDDNIPPYQQDAVMKRLQEYMINIYNYCNKRFHNIHHYVNYLIEYIKLTSALPNNMPLKYMIEFFKECIKNGIILPTEKSTQHFYSIDHIQIVESLSYLVNLAQYKSVSDQNCGLARTDWQMENEMIFRRRVLADIQDMISYV